LKETRHRNGSVAPVAHPQKFMIQGR